MSKATITNFYIKKDERDYKNKVYETIDRYTLSSTPIKWNVKKHVRYLDKINILENVGRNPIIVLNSRIVTEGIHTSEITDVLKDAPDAFDLLILDYNRCVDAIDRVFDLVKYPSRNLQETNHWRETSYIQFEDISVYVLSVTGFKKLLKGNLKNSLKDLSTFYYTGNNMFEQKNEWSVSNYLENGSPILVCHLLQKFLGSKAGVFARPIYEFKGFNVNAIHICLLLTSFFGGILGVSGVHILRFVSLCFSIEPLEGLYIKIVFFLIASKLLHLYGNDPIFFW